ncbi:MAG TPA: GGDEF domain-containing protein [Sulfurimonas sp.]|nr:GGDEF domain-containing protein [Sulfurimonas sp.]
MTIDAIINKAVKRLKLEGKLLTPDFYAEAFCKEAKKAGMNVEDCNHLEKFTKSLNSEFQKDLKNYHIKTQHEFVRFIISKLNRTNPTQATQTIEAQNLLTKRILQAVEVLHNKEAAELAKKTIDILGAGAKAEQIDAFRQRWVNFLTTYDDTFLQKLKALGSVDSSDLKKSIEALNLEAGSTSMVENSSVLEKVSKLLVSSFVPSIASSVNDTIANISIKIRQNPSLLESDSIEQEIKTAISLRIALDKESVKEMVESIDGVLDKLSLRLIDMIEKSDNSNEEIQSIKKDLEAYGEDPIKNFKTAHKKLYTIAIALEKNTQLLSKDLKNHSGEVNALSVKVKKLEKELAAAKEESKEDFLTKLYNRRALDDFMEIKEAEFKRYKRNFSVVMFDLDKFKDVNDTFGHDAGDAVLVAFAKILKKECRSVDVVGRFGGEEFLAILSETDTKGGVIFAEKVRKHVEKARFMYKGKRISVTVSSGVSERKKHISLSATINSADEYLYVAKTNGRNRVEYKKK